MHMSNAIIALHVQHEVTSYNINSTASSCRCSLSRQQTMGGFTCLSYWVTVSPCTQSYRQGVVRFNLMVGSQTLLA